LEDDQFEDLFTSLIETEEEREAEYRKINKELRKANKRIKKELSERILKKEEKEEDIPGPPTSRRSSSSIQAGGQGEISQSTQELNDVLNNPKKTKKQ
jgi:hypothetical protein